MRAANPLKILLSALLIFFISSCRNSSNKTLTQVSTIDALLAGYYDGVLKLGELSKYGNFGIGTFHKLDGEMIMLDGTIYQFKADGKIYKPDNNSTTPFAAVTNFKHDFSFLIEGSANLAEIENTIGEKIKNKNLFYAVKITGKFNYVKTRSVPAQSKPYKPLNEITKTQPVFERENEIGVLVGFKLPPFTSGINVPGYHLHFLLGDRSFGGHLLDAVIENAVVEIQQLNNFYMLLPENDSSFGEIDLSKDRKKELYEVEK